MGDENNTLRILIATDCHLGYLEKDEIRKNDSFNTFDEICSIASQRQVDFILLGGDLFHENKPSSTTLVRTIEILRRYCLNDSPVQFQVVSDQTINFPNRFGHVNYEDAHYNVGLPIFTIHGNHDDPAGVDNISAIDILSASNLVNYFGKMVLGGSGVGQIALHPVLITKGTTKVALYGLGNIRDERLNRMFQTPHCVEWIRPENQDGCSASEWFNIFVLHQNRVKTNPKNAINEHFLARFLDFIIWGHEHECLVDPQEVAGMGFHLTQPGSSVATALTEGEAKPKHVLLLEIKESQYRPTKIPLQTVRPFEFADVSLKEDADVDTNDQAAVIEYLGRVVQEMMARATQKSGDRRNHLIPLIRLRVDYTGLSTINPQRFGQKFVGKVANPHDILSFTKATRKKQPNEKLEHKEMLQPEELNQQNIEALVAESNPQMEILPVSELAMALHDFVNKDDKQAFSLCVQHNLEETQNKLVQEGDVNEFKEEDVIQKVNQHMQQREEELKAKGFAAIGSAPWSQAENTNQPRGLSTAREQSKHASNDFSDDDIGNKSPEPRSTLTSGGSTAARGSGRGRGRGRGRGKASESFKQTTLDTSLRSRQSQRAASAVTTTRNAGVMNEETGTGAGSPEASAEEVEEPDSDSEPIQTPRAMRGRKRTTPIASQGRGRGRASKRGRKYESVATRTSFVDDDEDDEDEGSNLNKPKSPQVRRSWGSLRR